MGRITIELLRKRSEHNEGDISTLEELALHQEKIIRIENLDKWCRHLKILLLQNNSIAKLENLSRLKCLEYLNVAMNNIEVIDGLEGCESLRKLDLTLNFIGQVSSVSNLKKNYFLEELYLTGNPCVDFKGYRDFVLSNAPRLKSLDGVEVSQSERILARQTLPEIRPTVTCSEGKHSMKRDAEKSMELPDINDENFWNIPSPDTPEVRAQIHRKQEEEAKKANGDVKKDPPKPRKLFDDNGVPFNVNEGKYEFSLTDSETEGLFVVNIKLPKYMDTSLVKLDVQPKYIRAIIKNKILQLALSEEVKPDQSTAQRSQTGVLVVSMPKLNQNGIITFGKSKAVSRSRAERLKLTPKEPECSEIEKNLIESGRPIAGTYLRDVYVDESEVPPLI